MKIGKVAPARAKFDQSIYTIEIDQDLVNRDILGYVKAFIIGGKPNDRITYSLETKNKDFEIHPK